MDYNEVIQFMEEFEADFINRFGEIIIHEPSNTYTLIKKCRNIKEVERNVVFALCRPIGKGLDKKTANRLLDKVNKYFNVELTREDMLLMYTKLCYVDKLEKFEGFIKRGFPMEELKKELE